MNAFTSVQAADLRPVRAEPVSATYPCDGDGRPRRRRRHQPSRPGPRGRRPGAGTSTRACRRRAASMARPVQMLMSMPLAFSLAFEPSKRPAPSTSTPYSVNRPPMMRRMSKRLAAATSRPRCSRSPGPGGGGLSRAVVRHGSSFPVTRTGCRAGRSAPSAMPPSSSGLRYQVRSPTSSPALRSVAPTPRTRPCSSSSGFGWVNEAHRHRQRRWPATKATPAPQKVSSRSVRNAIRTPPLYSEVRRQRRRGCRRAAPRSPPSPSSASRTCR